MDTWQHAHHTVSQAEVASGGVCRQAVQAPAGILGAASSAAVFATPVISAAVPEWHRVALAGGPAHVTIAVPFDLYSCQEPKLRNHLQHSRLLPGRRCSLCACLFDCRVFVCILQHMEPWQVQEPSKNAPVNSLQLPTTLTVPCRGPCVTCSASPCCWVCSLAQSQQQQWHQQCQQQERR